MKLKIAMSKAWFKEYKIESLFCAVGRTWITLKCYNNLCELFALYEMVFMLFMKTNFDKIYIALIDKVLKI